MKVLVADAPLDRLGFEVDERLNWLHEVVGVLGSQAFLAHLVVVGWALLDLLLAESMIEKLWLRMESEIIVFGWSAAKWRGVPWINDSIVLLTWVIAGDPKLFWLLVVEPLKVHHFQE